VTAPSSGQFDVWKQSLLSELKRVSFRHFPPNVPAAKSLGPAADGSDRLESEEGIEFRLRGGEMGAATVVHKVLLVVLNEDEAGAMPAWAKKLPEFHDAAVACEPRGIGATKWTRKNGPNYVERSHALLGSTVDTGRVCDVIAAAKLRRGDSRTTVHVAGKGTAGLIAAYAAVLSDDIAGVTLIAPPTTHMDPAAPQFLNCLRVCDVPTALSLIAPRSLTISEVRAGDFVLTKAAYSAAGAADQLTIK